MTTPGARQPAQRADVCAHPGRAGGRRLCSDLGPDVNGRAGGRWRSTSVACLTDWLDGYLARVWHQQSTLGRMLDPIADKLLVGATLLMLTHDNTIDGVQVWAAVIILCREILVSGLREFLAELNVKVHVTQLAKWKTTLQMIALGVLLAGPAGDKLVPGITWRGLVLLWVAALLTLWTGFDYLKAAVRTAIER